jgi:RING finger protein 113A
MKNFRKRDRSDDSEEESLAVGAAEARKAVASRLNPSTKAPLPAPAASAASVSLTRELGGGYLAQGGLPEAALESVVGDAVAVAESLVAPEREGRARLEHSVALQKATLAELEGGGARTYRGAAGYTDFRSGPKDAKEAVAAAKQSGALGPSRAPSNVRGICRVDYAPDVCKDWKETGQCPFGDSCIFLHDRGDYKSGWQIERDWAAAKKAREKRVAEVLAAGGTLEEAEAAEKAAEAASGEGGGASAAAAQPPPLPFACHICRGPFQAPVLTACGHYFCERCAVERNKASGDCALCGEATSGIFHAAPKLRAALAQRKAVAEEAGGAAGAGAAGGGSEAEEQEAEGEGGWEEA